MSVCVRVRACCLVCIDKTTTENKKKEGVAIGPFTNKKIMIFAQKTEHCKCKGLILYDQLVQEKTIIHDDQKEANVGENSELFMKIL